MTGSRSGASRRAHRLGAGALVLLLGLGGALAACGGGDDPFEGSESPSSSAAADGADPTASTAGDAGSTTTAGGADGEAEIDVGLELPDGWPDDLPLPDDAVLELGQRTEGADGSVLLTADLFVDDDGANVYTAYLESLQDELDATILQRSSGETDTGYVGSISFSTDDYRGNVAVDDLGEGTTLTISVVLDG